LTAAIYNFCTHTDELVSEVSADEVVGVGTRVETSGGVDTSWLIILCCRGLWEGSDLLLGLRLLCG
jgi:hypothetical protein